MHDQRLKGGLALWCLLALATPAEAGDCGDCRQACCPAPAACAPQCAPTYRTVQVPQWTTETRTVTCTEYRSEPRERTITVAKQVWQPQEQTYTVMVPQQEERTANRT